MTSKIRRTGIGALCVAGIVATLMVSGPQVTATPRGAAAATAGPPFGFVGPITVKNASFEQVGPNGSPTTWNPGDPTPPPSAAKAWFMHTDNFGASVTSELVPTSVPGPGGGKMLHFIAGGNEGGVYQDLRQYYPAGVPASVMFSVWVLVRSGHVAVQPNGGTSGPVAWSTKVGEWEQLRVCTDGTVPVDLMVIYNQDPAGGDFYIDRVEVKQTA